MIFQCLSAAVARWATGGGRTCAAHLLAKSIKPAGKLHHRRRKNCAPGGRHRRSRFARQQQQLASVQCISSLLTTGTPSGCGWRLGQLPALLIERTNPCQCGRLRCTAGTICL
jgi:hypothetical protein